MKCSELADAYTMKYGWGPYLVLQNYNSMEAQLDLLAEIFECALSVETPADLKKCEALQKKYEAQYGQLSALTSFYEDANLDGFEKVEKILECYFSAQT